MLVSYKIVIEPLFSDDQKIKRKKFVNSLRTNSRKERAMRILSLDETFCDIDGIYNFQNDRMCVADRADANKKSVTRQPVPGM